ncbi:hypothetical protein V6N12_028328 [Hibiscus sabdariffa]|uniref:Uncharacterized protein n=1 Tax=Hibiscus sabdariffa TaxID=183260 RepID=A0ABR2F5H8_9ROSI
MSGSIPSLSYFFQNSTPDALDLGSTPSCKLQHHEWINPISSLPINSRMMIKVGGQLVLRGHLLTITQHIMELLGDIINHVPLEGNNVKGNFRL